MTQTHWEVLKWMGNAALLLATLTMISPHVASTAVTPWALFLLGNLIWLADSIHVRSWPWVYIAAFLATWDTLIIISRLTSVQLFGILEPFTIILNTLP